jgi:hypothetical protein
MNRRLTVSSLLVAALMLASCGRDSSQHSLLGTGTVRRLTFQYVKEKEGGCNDVFFHKGSADGREILWVAADKKKLRLPRSGSKTFDLAEAADGLTVAVDLWPTAPRFSPYCNDIAPDNEKEVTWHAKKGKVTITIGKPVGPQDAGMRRYLASVRLEDVVFEDEEGNQATLPEEKITDVAVGWYAG